ncbi:alpha/beta hydrolase [Candidatus Pelagibacter communis]|uniref:alpha/beta hydrolase n=1 Tax=Pelagibacter ubique TaxID=198252 RepID=UPI00094C7ADB|nr:serine esterase [Candidatus Pelagibacter ubique]|tara:strand:- start:172 stop:828 length:657 start_codon:yes stop_codon:yes gene_type:complete
MTFCLDSTIIKPEKSEDINSIVVLLHGYGGDGKDISMLSLNWKRYMPNTIFICPNGHEVCSINPGGYQWFDLSLDDPKYILEQCMKAEKKLNKFLDEIKRKYSLDNNRIILSGFSQGCMMSINVGLTASKKFNSILGFSGKIIDLNDLKQRKKNNTSILLIHGDQDDIVSPTHLLEAKDFLLREKIDVESHLIRNCGHHIPIDASSIALNYMLKKLTI